MPGSPVFHPTRWTLIQRSRGRDEEARVALSELCDIYYEPVHAFVRHWSGGGSGEEARDLAHAFFEDLLKRESIGGTVEAGRGRFRSYLLGAVKHFLLRQRQRGDAIKRGGELERVELSDELAGEGSPDLTFDRDWAHALIARALVSLEAEMRAAGKERQFEVLKPWLDGGAAGSLEEAAATLGLNANALNVAIHRFRQRFLRLVRAEVESTTASAADAVEEFRHLVEVLVRG